MLAVFPLCTTPTARPLKGDGASPQAVGSGSSAAIIKEDLPSSVLAAPLIASLEEYWSHQLVEGGTKVVTAGLVTRLPHRKIACSLTRLARIDPKTP